MEGVGSGGCAVLSCYLKGGRRAVTVKTREAVVKLLLEKGAELESKSKYGQTPLSSAAANGHEAA